MEPQDRLGQDSRGKENIGEENKGEFEGEKTADKPPAPPRQSVPYEQVKTLYNDICTSLPKCRVLSDACVRQHPALWERCTDVVVKSFDLFIRD